MLAWSGPIRLLCIIRVLPRPGYPGHAGTGNGPPESASPVSRGLRRPEAGASPISIAALALLKGRAAPQGAGGLPRGAPGLTSSCRWTGSLEADGCSSPGKRLARQRLGGSPGQVRDGPLRGGGLAAPGKRAGRPEPEGRPRGGVGSSARRGRIEFARGEDRIRAGRGSNSRTGLRESSEAGGVHRHRAASSQPAPATVPATARDTHALAPGCRAPIPRTGAAILSDRS